MKLLAPMLCSPVADAQADQFLEDHDDLPFAYEQKADGHRRLVYVIDGEVIPLNRSGERTTLPVAMIRVLAAQQLNFAIDGELVGTGHNKLLWAYDLPWLETLIEPAMSFRERRAALETLHHGMLLDGAGIRLLPSVSDPTEKRWLRRTLQAQHAEGVVVKDLEAPYLPGFRGRRSRQMWKVKWRKTVDCVVTGLGIDGHDNIGLGVYDQDGQLLDVGEVTAQAGDGRLIIAAFNRADAPHSVVVEVTCANATKGNRLFSPTLPRLRTDKPPAECTLSQLDDIRDDRQILMPEYGRRRAAGE